MGMFINYDKPGKGVDKNERKKKGIFLFFELFTRKFRKFFPANILYFLVSLPISAIYYFFASGVMAGMIEDLNSEYYTQMSLILTSIIVILFGTGPVSCGYTFILRNFAREEHVWIGSDFFERIKSNFKQGAIILISDILVIFVGTNAISFYYAMYRNGNKLCLYMLGIVCIFMALYTFMHFYLYQFAITFENKISDVFRNSLIMAFASMPMNIFLTVFVVVATYLVMRIFTPVAIGLLMLVCWISFMRFPIDFHSTRVIQKKVIDRMQVSDKESEN